MRASQATGIEPTNAACLALSSFAATRRLLRLSVRRAGRATTIFRSANSVPLHSESPAMVMLYGHQALMLWLSRSP